MTIIPINGLNERMGKYFSTPKHLLLYKGTPAIHYTVSQMKEFGSVRVLIGAYYPDVAWVENVRVKPTKNVVDTIKQTSFKDKVFIVDCDVVPIRLNPPRGTTVYLFRNENKFDHYSNFKIKDGLVTECNEKGEVFEWAGAGIYYFEMNDDFYNHSVNATSISEILARMVKAGKKVHADTTSEIFRFGTIKDICS